MDRSPVQSVERMQRDKCVRGGMLRGLRSEHEASDQQEIERTLPAAEEGAYWENAREASHRDGSKNLQIWPRGKSEGH